MGKRPLIRLAAVAAGGMLGLAAAAPALATGDDTITADLRQSNVTADDNEFAAGAGDCEGVEVQNGEAGWVFVWPGNQVTDLVSLQLNFDTDGDGTADVTLTEVDATETLDEGTLKVWVTTDATWVLVDGTSEVEGALPPPADGQEPKFNLTHICGEGDNGDNGEDENGEDENGEDENGGDENGGDENGGDENGGDENGGDENGGDEGLPVTGPGVGTLLLLSGGLLTAGGAMLLVRRRRNLLGLLDG